LGFFIVMATTTTTTFSPSPTSKLEDVVDDPVDASLILLREFNGTLKKQNAEGSDFLLDRKKVDQLRKYGEALLEVCLESHFNAQQFKMYIHEVLTQFSDWLLKLKFDATGDDLDHWFHDMVCDVEDERIWELVLEAVPLCCWKGKMALYLHETIFYLMCSNRCFSVAKEWEKSLLDCRAFRLDWSRMEAGRLATWRDDERSESEPKKKGRERRKKCIWEVRGAQLFVHVSLGGYVGELESLRFAGIF